MNITGKGWGFCPHCYIKYLPFLSPRLRTSINSMLESYPLKSGEYNHFAELKPISEMNFWNSLIESLRSEPLPRTHSPAGHRQCHALCWLEPPRLGKLFLGSSSWFPPYKQSGTEVSSLSQRTVQTCPSFQGFNHKNITNALISSSADFIWTAKDWGVTANLWFKIKRVTAQLSFERKPFLLSGAH